MKIVNAFNIPERLEEVEEDLDELWLVEYSGSDGDSVIQQNIVSFKNENKKLVNIHFNDLLYDKTCENFIKNAFSKEMLKFDIYDERDVENTYLSILYKIKLDVSRQLMEQQ